MKAQILKIAGVKSEKEFYKKYPSEEAFMKKHGKEFKKAQTGNNIATSNAGSFNIYNPYGDAMQSADMSGMTGADYTKYSDLGQAPNFSVNMPQGFPKQQSSFSMAAPNFNAYDPQGDQAGTGMAQGIFSGAHSVEDSPFGKKGGGIGGGIDPMKSVMGAFTGIVDAANAHKENKKLTKKMETWAKVSDVQKRAGISNAFAEKPKNQWFRPDDPRFIHSANELSNTQGRGTDVITQNGGVFQGGGEIQNTFAPGTIYDDLGYEPFDESNDDVKAYQDGGGFGNSQDYYNQIINSGKGSWLSQANSSLGGGTSFVSNIGVGSPFDSMIGGGTTGGDLGGKIGAFGGPATAMLGSMVGRYFDKNPGRQKHAQNTMNSNNAFLANLNTAGDITGGLQNMGVGQNGEALQPYEDGGWVSNDWTPQVIASFGGLDEQEVYDYAHEGMDTLRAGGHMRDYTPVSNQGMETYAMGGQLQTHGTGEAETISYNPYMPGSGEMSMLRGPSHKDGGIDISYGNAQNGSVAPQVNAEGGEPVIEMQGGGQMDPRTGQPSVEAVVLGNIPASLKLAKATGDEDLINLFTKYDGKTIKSIGNSLAKDNQKTEKYKNVVSKLVNDSDETADGLLKKKTGEIVELAIEARYKQNAKEQMKLANWQSAVNDTKKDISYMKGKNISAEDLGKGKIKPDYDPITKDAELESPYAKHGAYLRKAQTGVDDVNYTSKYGIVPWQGNTSPGNKYGKATASGFSAKQWDEVADKLGFKGKGNKEFEEFLLQNKESAPLIKARHQNLYGKDPWIDPEHFGYGWASDQLLLPAAAEIPADTTPAKTTTATTDKKEIDVVPLKQNKFGQYADMLRQFLPSAKLPGIDPRQFAGEYMAMSQNQYEPVPSQHIRMQLDPMTRVSYQDIRNQSTADFKDALKQGAFDPAVAAGVFGKKALADQSSYAEEFRANQGLEQQIYGGNRGKINQEMAANLQLNADQMNKQSLALSKTKEINQKAIASIADKYLQHDARDLEYKVKSNMFPTFAYDASGSIRTQGPGFQPNIPQVYGGKSNIKQVPVYDTDGKTILRYQMQEGDGTNIPSTATPPLVALTKNGGSVGKNNRSSVVKNAKNGSIVKLHKNF